VQQFADLWAVGTVSPHQEDSKIIEHASVGPFSVECDVLAGGDAEL
jgi:hypothetical protein